MSDNDPYVGGISLEYRNSATDIGRPALGEGEEKELKLAAIEDEKNLATVKGGKDEEDKPEPKKAAPKTSGPKPSASAS